MPIDRKAGILLHPTSLPGAYGIGDLGPQAVRWIDWLASAGQTLWQLLPLGPTGYADSPYQCLSAFAGNTLLISPDRLREEGLLTEDDLAPLPSFPQERVDFPAVIEFKRRILHAAWERFRRAPDPGIDASFRAFQAAQAEWLGDYSLFLAIKREHADAPWWEWGRPLALRQARALKAAALRLAEAVEENAFTQFLFFRQWADLRRTAAGKGVRLIGDVPIFVALDSADVWAGRRMFRLDSHGRPTHVAGVPPDYFSPTGQLWGNPLYNWDVHREEGYAWWIRRMHSALDLCDLVRIDHFRGFEAYWEVPADQPTAEHGRWVPGPGADFFVQLRAALGWLPLIAEDLGVITPGVVEMREQFGLPGMRILQFAFDGRAENPYLPHQFEPHSVVYTGTHDNDTTLGWYRTITETERDLVRRYLARDGGDIAWDLLRTAWSSVAETALAPLQDVLGFGGDARMNLPGRPHGNWTWRFREWDLRPDIAFRLREATELYGRMPRPAKPAPPEEKPR